VSRGTDLIKSAFGEEVDLVAFFADEARARELLTELLHPDAEFEFIRSAGEGGAFAEIGPRRGVEGVVEAWGQWLEPFSSYRTQGRGAFAIEGGLLTVVHASGVTRNGAVALEEDHGSVWRLRDGKVSRWEAWLHADDAKAACGL
jgi:ketosteroid isomerase-like protein